ncbi:hypothetical protein F751_1643 [Auxenochlorella protothecoides]|uniref:Uncharacterized protein n=1 Tax=Auxenochlorella protothecoides TaxID=3075 RepID=A0A087SU63_AUXPR|nr:hypothetical protein F751_1643 [Auxenochlorella protothecoides]KFM29267.1 hypothetical protein F751_1643 [Auxenochlorella protothecoides]
MGGVKGEGEYGGLPPRWAIDPSPGGWGFWALHSWPLPQRPPAVVSAWAGPHPNPRPHLYAACTAAPEEMPHRMPSSWASFRATATASCVRTRSTSSSRLKSRTRGMKPAPSPSICSDARRRGKGVMGRAWRGGGGQFAAFPRSTLTRPPCLMPLAAADHRMGACTRCGTATKVVCDAADPPWPHPRPRRRGACPHWRPPLTAWAGRDRPRTARCACATRPASRPPPSRPGSTAGCTGRRTGSARQRRAAPPLCACPHSPDAAPPWMGVEWGGSGMGREWNGGCKGGGGVWRAATPMGHRSKSRRVGILGAAFLAPAPAPACGGECMGRPPPQPPASLVRGVHGCARGDAAQDALLLGQLPRNRHGLLRAHAQYLVQQAEVQDSRDETRAQPLNLLGRAAQRERGHGKSMERGGGSTLAGQPRPAAVAPSAWGAACRRMRTGHQGGGMQP